MFISLYLVHTMLKMSRNASIIVLQWIEIFTKTGKFFILLLLLFIFCQPTAKTTKQTLPIFAFPYKISCCPASRVAFKSKILVPSEVITYLAFSTTREAIKDREFGPTLPSKTACCALIINWNLHKPFL